MGLYYMQILINFNIMRHNLFVNNFIFPLINKFMRNLFFFFIFTINYLKSLFGFEIAHYYLILLFLLLLQVKTVLHRI